MIDPAQCVTITDEEGKLFLRESVASGDIGGRPCEITSPVGGVSFLFELPAHEDKPRVQWLVKLDAEAIFNAMVESC